MLTLLVLIGLLAPAGATTTTTVAPYCGDRARNTPSEECDGADLGGATCPPSAPGVVTCTPGTCRLDRSGCGLSTTTTTLRR